MFNRLYSFTESNKCMYDLQFGLRQKHSTNHALLNMTRQIEESIDKGEIGIGVYVIGKLEHYGIRGVSNIWYASYLANRQQYVPIGGIKS